MGGHVDDAEHDLTRAVSLSLRWRVLAGGETRDAPPTALWLRSGDAVVFAGPARRSYHGVPRVLEHAPAGTPAGAGAGGDVDTMVRVKAYELRTKNKGELLKQLEELKNELAQLRVAKTQKGKLREVYAGKKFVPKDLRAKKTRALRRALTADEKSKKTLKQAKKDANFPARKFAVVA
ncbi:ribosomal protein [Aureococcus anophagefferens]|nr:ribosomal protein [Aureococcus anophagefferens]